MAETGRGSRPEHAAPAHVTIRGLCKRFNEAVVYDRFDFDIPRGKLTSIFGPNGCGNEVRAG